MKKITFILMAFMVCIGFASCSNDDDNYTSKLPDFSDITFSSEVIHASQTVTATAVQHTKGTLLNSTSYAWKIIISGDSAISASTPGVIYDNNSSNPSWTFTAPSISGKKYTLTFQGTYNISGKVDSGSRTAEIENGTASYQWTPIKGIVTINKTFYVYP